MRIKNIIYCNNFYYYWFLEFEFWPLWIISHNIWRNNYSFDWYLDGVVFRVTLAWLWGTYLVYFSVSGCHSINVDLRLESTCDIYARRYYSGWSTGSNVVGISTCKILSQVYYYSTGINALGISTYRIFTQINFPSLDILFWLGQASYQTGYYTAQGCSWGGGGVPLGWLREGLFKVGGQITPMTSHRCKGNENKNSLRSSQALAWPSDRPVSQAPTHWPSDRPVSQAISHNDQRSKHVLQIEISRQTRYIESFDVGPAL